MLAHVAFDIFLYIPQMADVSFSVDLELSINPDPGLEPDLDRDLDLALDST